MHFRFKKKIKINAAYLQLLLSAKNSFFVIILRSMVLFVPFDAIQNELDQNISTGCQYNPLIKLLKLAGTKTLCVNQLPLKARERSLSTVSSYSL